MSPPPDDDVTRRTRLAAERTWLAWWRSGIAAATAAVAVGGVVPELVDGGRTAYVVLGGGATPCSQRPYSPGRRCDESRWIGRSIMVTTSH